MNKQEILTKVFTQLTNLKIDYIVLRNHKSIPNSITLSNDLDIICKREQRKELIKLLKYFGFKFRPDGRFRNIYLYGTYPHDHFRSNKIDLHIDIVYNLSYRSTNKGEWVPAHAEIQQSIWKNITYSDTIWKCEPSKEDELVHIIAHSILDKRVITPAYSNRITELLKNVDIVKVLSLLEHLFFAFTPHLIQLLQNKEFENVFNKYISFGDY